MPAGGHEFEVKCLTAHLAVDDGALRISESAMELLTTAGAAEHTQRWYWSELKAYGYVHHVACCGEVRELV